VTYALSLYGKFIRIAFKARMEYRFSFVVEFVVNAMMQVTNLFAIWVIIHRFESLQGWSFGEIAFLGGLLGTCRGIQQIFFAAFDRDLETWIVKGDFDRFLLRPMNTLFLVVASGFNMEGINQFVLNVAIIVYANSLLKIEWTFSKLGYMLVAVLGGSMVAVAISFGIASLIFKFLRAGALRGIVFQTRHFVQYPLKIYGRWAQYLLTFILPFAFLSYYPATYFLDRTGETLFHPYFAYGTPAAGLIAFGIAYIIWRKGVNSYQSSGS
jgi:ABC-2 type transport system permease protein